jgi:uncharacterized protein (DUF2141 family)
MNVFLLYLAQCLLFSSPPPTKTLVLEINNLEQESNSQLIYSVYTSHHKFLDERDLHSHGKVEVHNGKQQMLSIEVPTNQGRIAIAVFQDLNKNGKLDKNIAGIPKEPYGFSLNFRPTFRGPKFEEAAFSPQKVSKLTIELIY